MTMATTRIPSRSKSVRGARLVSVDGWEVPLRGTHIRTRAQGGIARVFLEQTFQHTGNSPLRLSYLLPLPDKAAVSGFSFELDGERTTGVVKVREDARAAFEEALLDGRSAALLEEESSTLFRQEIGNVPPGAEVVVTIEIDQRLAWLAAAGAWEWRFPTVVAPRYQPELVGDREAQRNEIPIADLPPGHSLPIRATLTLAIGDSLHGDVSSPSHPMDVLRGNGATNVEFQVKGLERMEGVPLDRDVVVRWPVAEASPGVTISVDPADRFGDEFGLLTIVPPLGTPRVIPRDLIVLLDTSGSMSGEPLDQAVRVVSSLVETLGEHDRLELIEFSNRTRRWKRAAAQATDKNRGSAKRWLGKLRASGSTDMHSAIREALALLGPESQRQVLVVTDGLIGGESELVLHVADQLPKGCRVHTLGIGHGVNRTLTAGAARAGRGVEQVVAPGEDVTTAVRELTLSMREPVLVDLEVTGSALAKLARPADDVLAGSPALIPVRLKKSAERGTPGRLTVTGRTAAGDWSASVELNRALPAAAQGGGHAALFAREEVQELETVGILRRGAEEANRAIEAIGVTFQIATTRTSWVAVTDDATVDPLTPTRNVAIPHGMTAGLSAQGLGLRPATRSAFVNEAVSFGRSMAPGGAAAGSTRGRKKSMKTICFLRPGLAEKLEKEERAARLEPRFDDRVSPADRPAAVLLGRLLLRDEHRLVVSAEAVRAFDLEYGSRTVTLRLQDGSTISAGIDARASTEEGHIDAGLTVRLVVKGDFTGLTIVEIVLDGGLPEPLVVQVAPDDSES